MPALLALHGVRVLGGPSVDAIAERFGLARAEVRECLLDGQASGWVTRHDFFGETWSLTERGRAENERQLAAELEIAGARGVVGQAHLAFLPLNRRHGQACTDWQLRPTSWDPLAANDHTDPIWDDRVLVELEVIDAELCVVAATLTNSLARFAGYAERHAYAVSRVRAGQHEWLDSPERPSCQLVWIQLHEDLLASLQIPRGSDG